METDIHTDEPEITAVIQGGKWTTEGRIIAALIVRLGGKVELSASELLLVEGLVMTDNGNGGVMLAATSHINKRRNG
jgi:hypothetical protein